MGYNEHMQGQDIALLLKLAILNEPQVPRKTGGEPVYLSFRSIEGAEALCGFRIALRVQRREKGKPICAYGISGAWIEVRLSTRQGISHSRSSTAAAAEPLKSRFLEDGEPPAVWPYAAGKVRGMSLARSTRERPKPRCSIQSSMAFSLSATQSAVEERGNET